MRLVFDTSTQWTVVGIYDHENWLVCTYQQEVQSQSKQLFARLQEILQNSEYSVRDIEEIAVGVGPGSYTGLRIGLTVAKAWAFAKQIPLFQFSSTKIFEAEAPDLTRLMDSDFAQISDINSIVPVYSNDHFA